MSHLRIILASKTGYFALKDLTTHMTDPVPPSLLERLLEQPLNVRTMYVSGKEMGHLWTSG